MDQAISIASALREAFRNAAPDVARLPSLNTSAPTVTPYELHGLQLWDVRFADGYVKLRREDGRMLFFSRDPKDPDAPPNLPYLGQYEPPSRISVEEAKELARRYAVAAGITSPIYIYAVSPELGHPQYSYQVSFTRTHNGVPFDRFRSADMFIEMGKGALMGFYMQNQPIPPENLVPTVSLETARLTAYQYFFATRPWISSAIESIPIQLVIWGPYPPGIDRAEELFLSPAQLELARQNRGLLAYSVTIANADSYLTLHSTYIELHSLVIDAHENRVLRAAYWGGIGGGGTARSSKSKALSVPLGPITVLYGRLVRRLPRGSVSPVTGPNRAPSGIRLVLNQGNRGFLVTYDLESGLLSAGPRKAPIWGKPSAEVASAIETLRMSER